MVVAASADHSFDLVVRLSVACRAWAMATLFGLALSNRRDAADHICDRGGPMDMV